MKETYLEWAGYVNGVIILCQSMLPHWYMHPVVWRDGGKPVLVLFCSQDSNRFALS